MKAGDVLATKEIIDKGVNKGHCEGFILGFGKSYSKSSGVCMPLHTDSDDVIGGVKAILDKNSVLRDKQLPASIAVGTALQELFPCSAKQ